MSYVVVHPYVSPSLSLCLSLCCHNFSLSSMLSHPLSLFSPCLSRFRSHFTLGLLFFSSSLSLSKILRAFAFCKHPKFFYLRDGRIRSDWLQHIGHKALSLSLSLMRFDLARTVSQLPDDSNRRSPKKSTHWNHARLGSRKASKLANIASKNPYIYSELLYTRRQKFPMPRFRVDFHTPTNSNLIHNIVLK